MTNSIGVTIQGVTAHGSSLLNYSDTYEAWDEEEGTECKACYGTGLDRDEIFDCEVCAGEGIVIPLVTALDKPASVRQTGVIARAP